MKLIESISKSILPSKLKEAISPAVGIQVDDLDRDAYLYRSLSSSSRDLSEDKLQRAATVAYWYWMTNPYAKRGLDILTDFIIGSGIQIKAADENVQELLEEFYFAEPWNFDIRMPEFLDVLHLFGELALPFEVNDRNGQLSIAYLDPANISKVNLDEKNALKTSSLKIKGRDDIIPVINSAEQTSQDLKLKQGVFFFQINKLVNAERGAGCLMSTIDTLGQLDDFMFAEIERGMLMRNFVWDITLTGMNDAQIMDYLKKEQSNPPRPGTIHVHNDRVAWQAITPDLKTNDTFNLFQIMFSTIAVSLGIPDHWLSSIGGNSNRATSYEMSAPVFKRLERRQKYVKSSFELMFDFVIQQAIIHKRQMTKGMISKGMDLSYVLSFPEISPRDLKGLAETFDTMTRSLALSEVQGWVKKQANMQITQDYLTREMGWEIPDEMRTDPNISDEEIEAKQDEKDTKDLLKLYAKNTNNTDINEDEE